MYPPGASRDNGLIHELPAGIVELIPELDILWTAMWILAHPGGVVWDVWLERLIASAQDGWAVPLGDFNHRWLSACSGRSVRSRTG